MKIDPKSDAPIFQQIADGIEQQILTGELPAGGFIPSVREMAVTLVVNPNTVAKAYQQLQTRKLVEAVRGQGLRVNGVKEQAADARRHALLRAKVKELVALAAALGFATQEIVSILEQSDDAASPRARKRP